VSGARPAGGDPFEALGDPNRRAIVELLGTGSPDGRSVGDLAADLPISRPAVSRHLRLLKAAGLVVEEPRGTRRLYRLHDEGLAAVRAYLDRVWGEAAARFTLTAENTRPAAERPRVPRSDADGAPAVGDGPSAAGLAPASRRRG
jgi:DNA-binding transcriptional ArsR family regulator